MATKIIIFWWGPIVLDSTSYICYDTPLNMNTSKISGVFKKFIALSLVGYFSLFSPVTALAVVSQPVSAPISIPVPVPAPTPTPIPTPTPTPTPNPTPSIEVTVRAVNINLGVGTSTPIFQIIAHDFVSSGVQTYPVSSTQKIKLTTKTSANQNIPNAYIQDVVLNIDPTLTSGTYSGTIVVTNSSGQAVYNIPLTVSVTSPIASKPDLIIDSFNTLGNGFKPNTSPNYDVTIKNIGAVTASNTDGILVTIHGVKPDGTALPGCNLGKKFNNLGPNYATTLRVTSCPKFDMPGIYRITAEVDPHSDGPLKTDRVNESNETNNTKTIAVAVISAPKVDLITPQSGVFASLVSVTGSKFGNKQGSVVFYNQKGQTPYGAIILDWSDDRVYFLVPAVAKGTYLVEIQTADGKESNRVSFTVTAAQPRIDLISPTTLKIGSYIMLWGDNFGSSGKVNFYKPGSQAAPASAINSYWSNNIIFAQIPKSLPGNQTYGIQVRTPNGIYLLDSSLKYRYISK